MILGTKDVEVLTVIRTTLLIRGKGVDGDPMRRITQYWSMEGELLCEVDINETMGCNVAGHVVRHKSDRCEHCDATLEYMQRVSEERR